ncbi:Cytochrome b561 [Cribrihabitans marinus]|uniref:Cytochrome b561 n=1 Tax=Cribrihabitans marinus TaxID=1227549 RepID=A0A1H6VL09_9RHOB|nr:cytochrome b/b6 domain-containing protein [Cribrihabitans marinus]GGH26152.1 cytochrome b561 [Cribrihabitans marinus]SEJ00845.1 Cytochrome b561 [Cribrihabitans marinus]
MPLANTTRSYGSVAKWFHWLTALLVLTNLPLGKIANTMAQSLRDPSTVASEELLTRTALLFSLHKTLGVAIFAVALARILWAITQTHPGPLNAHRRPEVLLAQTVHWLLYGSLVLVPLSGWIQHAATSGFAPILWPLGQDLPLVPKDPALAKLTGGLHRVLIWALAGAILLHVAGALKHHFIDRDATLGRMLSGGGAPEPAPMPRSLVPALAALAVWAAVIVIGAAQGLYQTPAVSGGAAQAAEPARPAASASDWQVTDGTLSMTVTQMGTPLTGQFSDWTADITFEPVATTGPAGQVQVRVAIASLSLGSVTSDALGPGFLEASQFPTARFIGQILKTETGYEAHGPLTLRDQSVDIVLPFDLQIQDGVATMAGNLTLDRRDFGVGAQVGDAATLGMQVVVEVALTAARKP